MSKYSKKFLNKKKKILERARKRFGDYVFTKEDAEGLKKAINEELIEYSRYLLANSKERRR